MPVLPPLEHARPHRQSLSAAVREWVLAALDLVFPAHCPVCGVALAAGRRDPLCGTCWRAIERIAAPRCPQCGRTLTASAGEDCTVAPWPCGACAVAPPVFAWARAGGRYAGALREAIHQLKFGRRPALARPLATLVLEECARELPPADALVPVPLAPDRERERGFNQARLLAERLGGALGLPVRARWLARARPTRPQTELDASERRQNVRGAFVASGRAGGRRVIVVDDVLTTGATADDCARALHAAGARWVGVLTVARVS